MANLKKRSKKSGLLPGSLVYVGEKKVNEVKISVIDYDENNFEEKGLKCPDDCSVFKNKPTVTWINVDGLHEPEAIDNICKNFDIHPLVLEDILNTDQRPKLEEFDKYLFLVVKMASFDEKKKHVYSEQVSIILGDNFVISFQEGLEGDVFDLIRDRIRNNKGRIRKMGPDYLAYSLIDAIVDNYFGIIERISDRLEAVEEELVSNPTTKTLRIIYDLKREIILLRKFLWPQREVINFLLRGDSELIKDSTKIYLKDVYDHTIQIIDSIDTYRDMLAGMLDIYLSSISNRLNEVMKVLTIIATIFMPLTFIAGVYGMNFKYMPEINWIFGYPFILGLMLFIAFVMLIYFKRKKWI